MPHTLTPNHPSLQPSLADAGAVLDETVATLATELRQQGVPPMVSLLNPSTGSSALERAR